MNQFRSRIIFLLIIILISFSISSHIEPGKTRSERSLSEKERLRIKQQKIKTIRIYKNLFIHDSLTKERYLYQIHDYDTNGNVLKITSYKAKDTLEMTVVYKYDQNFNLILDMDLDANGKLIEKVEYKYDKDNLLLKGQNFNSQEKLVAIFDYSTLKSDTVVKCIKRVMPVDTIEYTIDYKYNGFTDSSNLVSVHKYSGNKQLMRTESKFNKRNQRTQKLVYDENDKMYIKWLYYYDAAGNNTRISRFDSLSKFEYAIDRTYDEFRNTIKLRKVNNDRKFTDYQTFEFEYYK